MPDPRPVSTPAPRTRAPEGDHPTQPVTDALSAFCTCGHEQPNHRHGRCWIGWDGNPVHRTRTAIACPCTGWEPTP